jgi:hypothetical protein
MTADDPRPSEITVRQGFFPIVTGDEINFTQSRRPRAAPT